VSRFVTVTSLALRELWISFRLLAVLGVLFATSLPTPFAGELPPVSLPFLPPQGALIWFALPLGAAMAVVSAVAAGALGGERTGGSAGWVVVRAVPRSTVLVAWFAAFALLLILGTVAAATVVWLSLEPLLVGSALDAFATTVGASTAAGLACLGAGLLVGAILPPRPAALITLVGTGGTLVAATLLGRPDVPSPLAGLSLLARLDEASRPVADGLRATGVALALTGGLLLTAAAAFDRADL
jgi:hypothetical protein